MRGHPRTPSDSQLLSLLGFVWPPSLRSWDENEEEKNFVLKSSAVNLPFFLGVLLLNNIICGLKLSAT